MKPLSCMNLTPSKTCLRIFTASNSGRESPSIRAHRSSPLALNEAKGTNSVRSVHLNTKGLLVLLPLRNLRKNIWNYFIWLIFFVTTMRNTKDSQTEILDFPTVFISKFVSKNSNSILFSTPTRSFLTLDDSCKQKCNLFLNLVLLFT